MGVPPDPGELLKLGIRVSATTIATLLRRHGLGPAPRRGPTWGEFLRAQAQGTIACDFLTVETIRLKTLYVLVWIELHTRKVRLGGVTANPDSVWVTEQARNLVMDLRDEGGDVRFLVHDRDTKFTGSFDEVFATEGVRVIRTPIQARTPTPSASGGSEPPGRSAWTGCSSSDEDISNVCSASTWGTTTRQGRIADSTS